VSISHLALDLSTRHQGRHAVDCYDIDGSAANKRLSDFQSLLASIRLGNQQIVHVDPTRRGVHRIESVLHINVGGHSASFLCLRDDVLAEGGFPRRLGTENLGDSATRNPADTEGQV